MLQSQTQQHENRERMSASLRPVSLEMRPLRPDGRHISPFHTPLTRHPAGTVPFACSIDHGTMAVYKRSFDRLGAYLDQRKDGNLSPSAAQHCGKPLLVASIRNQRTGGSTTSTAAPELNGMAMALNGFRICQNSHLFAISVPASRELLLCTSCASE
ncbi:hypothetical protein BDP81DRAFT_121034 [Colletotrichum phormii]|uniref:Uncharacterized protein n=1 Tax=Colletotrichum phormii TaxID=359342 RepID=A0AAI9ZFL8_9PEZI|nr:uncharacterized protein BDP81DRAFT_121034 [Colletotrichum phormii]KAK1623353.1 hypothetical protein BDP81DRAFT_121034 [Colletotrichum phormii]